MSSALWFLVLLGTGAGAVTMVIFAVAAPVAWMMDRRARR